MAADQFHAIDDIPESSSIDVLGDSMPAIRTPVSTMVDARFFDESDEWIPMITTGDVEKLLIVLQWMDRRGDSHSRFPSVQRLVDNPSDSTAMTVLRDLGFVRPLDGSSKYPGNIHEYDLQATNDLGPDAGRTNGPVPRLLRSNKDILGDNIGVGSCDEIAAKIFRHFLDFALGEQPTDPSHAGGFTTLDLGYVVNDGLMVSQARGPKCRGGAHYIAAVLQFRLGSSVGATGRRATPRNIGAILWSRVSKRLLELASVILPEYGQACCRSFAFLYLCHKTIQTPPPDTLVVAAEWSSMKHAFDKAYEQIRTEMIDDHPELFNADMHILPQRRSDSPRLIVDIRIVDFMYSSCVSLYGNPFKEFLEAWFQSLVVHNRIDLNLHPIHPGNGSGPEQVGLSCGPVAALVICSLFRPPNPDSTALRARCGDLSVRQLGAIVRPQLIDYWQIEGLSDLVCRQGPVLACAIILGDTFQGYMRPPPEPEHSDTDDCYCVLVEDRGRPIQSAEATDLPVTRPCVKSHAVRDPEHTSSQGVSWLGLPCNRCHTCTRAWCSILVLHPVVSMVADTKKRRCKRPRVAAIQCVGDEATAKLESPTKPFTSRHKRSRAAAFERTGSGTTEKDVSETTVPGLSTCDGLILCRGSCGVCSECMTGVVWVAINWTILNVYATWPISHGRMISWFLCFAVTSYPSELFCLSYHFPF